MSSKHSSGPYFSVVIPTFNRSASLLQTLRSCWQQSFTDFEVILVDDGSTDDTAEVVQQIDDNRLQFVRQPNGGPANARNNGMRVAQGRFIAFLDSDDVWYPDHLANAHEAIESQDADYVYTQIIVDRGVGKYWVKPARRMEAHENIYDYLYVHGGFIQTSTLVISNSLARQVQWDENLTYGDNDQFAIDLWKAGSKPLMLPEPQTLYADRLSADALSQLPVFKGNSPQHTNFIGWMNSQRNDMPAQAQLAFAARFESVSLAQSHPVDALKVIWRAWRASAMSGKGALRQLMQSFSPRLYRKLTDQYVRLRGLPLSPAQTDSLAASGPES